MFCTISQKSLFLHFRSEELHVTGCPYKQTELQPTAPEEILPPSVDITKFVLEVVELC